MVVTQKLIKADHFKVKYRSFSVKFIYFLEPSKLCQLFFELPAYQPMSKGFASP